MHTDAFTKGFAANQRAHNDMYEKGSGFRPNANAVIHSENKSMDQQQANHDKFWNDHLGAMEDKFYNIACNADPESAEGQKMMGDYNQMRAN